MQKIYNKNKIIYLEWIKLMEEIQPKWNKISKEKQNLIRKILFEDYINGKYREQIITNIKKARYTFYNN